MRKSTKKLVAATSYLLGALVGLSSVTYAWFTLSTNPEITNITTTVSVNQNLEIALDNKYETGNDIDKASVVKKVIGDAQDVQGSTAGNAYSWGNYIDLSKAFEDVILELKPVAYSEEEDTLYTAEYDIDGRVSNLYNLGDHKTTLNADLTNTVTVEDGYGAVLYGDANSKYYGLKLMYWLRSNTECEVALSEEGLKRANSGEDSEQTGVNGVTGGGSYILIDDAKGNESESVKAYLECLAIRLDITPEGGSSSTLYIKPDLSNGFTAGQNIPLKLMDSADESANDATIPLTKGVATKLVMHLYLDGETVTNTDALLNKIENMDINLQFTSKEELTGAMGGETSSQSIYQNSN